jgi:cytochrome c5
MAESHSSPIKTPQQLVAVVVAAFVAPIVVIALLAALVTSGTKGGSSDPKVIAERIKPFGTLVIAGARVPLSGEQVYEQVCKTCHTPGLAGAPKLGDKAAWAKIIAQGEKTTVEHAIKGIRAMPPKGGNPELPDHEVHAAVVHLANAAGANWKMPATPPAAPAATAAAPAAPAEKPKPSIVAVPMPPPAAAGTAPAATGAKSVYDTACAACHAAGVAGAPKFGDKAAWAPRLAAGHEAMYAAALKGKGAMPPKGGQPQLTDAQVKSAVDLMTAAVK